MTTAVRRLKGVSLLGSSRGSADFEQSRIALIAPAWCLLAAGFGPRNLLLADNGEHGAEPLVLDNLPCKRVSRANWGAFCTRLLHQNSLDGSVGRCCPEILNFCVNASGSSG